MKYTVSAKTYDLPIMEFSIDIHSLTEAMRIAKRLADGFHDISVIESEETGEVIYTCYQSSEIFAPSISPEKAVFYAVAESRRRKEIL